MKLTTQRLKKLIQEELNEIDQAEDQKKSSTQLEIMAKLGFEKTKSALNQMLMYHYQLNSKDEQVAKLARQIIDVEREVQNLYETFIALKLPEAK